MFVYTFENINNIKNLKHSDSIKPKHQKKIDRIKDGLFAKFDYSKFKEKYLFYIFKLMMEKLD